MSGHRVGGIRDSRHVGERTQDFTQHFKIFKERYATDDTPWVVLWHKRPAGWWLVGRYHSQPEAMSAAYAAPWLPARKNQMIFPEEVVLFP